MGVEVCVMLTSIVQILLAKLQNLEPKLTRNADDPVIHEKV